MIRYYKGEPNVYAIRYRNGQLQSHGQGRDFWYFPFNTTITALAGQGIALSFHASQ